MERIAFLEQEILRHRDLYYNQGSPEITDPEYDRLEEELRSLSPTSPVLQKTGIEVESSAQWEKVPHTEFTGSLSKVKTPEEFLQWAAGFPGKKFFLTYKLDGLSIKHYYEDGIPVRSVTRGDGLSGHDILRNVKKMQGFPQSIPGFTGTLRAEILLLHEDFKDYFAGKVNPRNAAVGAAKELAGSLAQHLALFHYEVREVGKPPLPISEQFKWMADRHIQYPFPAMCCTPEEVVAEYRGMVEKKSHLPFDADGMVIWVNDPDALEKHGVDASNCPKAAIAFKFPSESKVGKVDSIRWDLGLGGRLTPVAILKEPLFLSGANVQNVSLHNLDFLLTHEVTMGSSVEIVRSGDVIPYLTRRVEEGAPFWKGLPQRGQRFESVREHLNLESFCFPETCPECKAPTTIEDAYVFCWKADCPGFLRGQVLKWVQTLDLKGVGVGLVTELVMAGKVKEPADLYTLTLADVSSIERRGEKHYLKMKEALEAKKVLKFADFMAALGIPYAGKKVWEHIQATGVQTLEDLKWLGPSDIAKAERMGWERAQDIHQHLVKLWPRIQKLAQVGVTIQEPVRDGKLSGKSFCISGTIQVELGGKRATKKDFGELLEKHGARMEPDVTRTLDYLIVADPSAITGKTQKAQKYGVRVISPQEALALTV